MSQSKTNAIKVEFRNHAKPCFDYFRVKVHVCILTEKKFLNIQVFALYPIFQICILKAGQMLRLIA